MFNEDYNFGGCLVLNFKKMKSSATQELNKRDGRNAISFGVFSSAVIKPAGPCGGW